MRKFLPTTLSILNGAALSAAMLALFCGQALHSLQHELADLTGNGCQHGQGSLHEKSNSAACHAAGSAVRHHEHQHGACGHQHTGSTEPEGGHRSGQSHDPHHCQICDVLAQAPLPVALATLPTGDLLCFPATPHPAQRACVEVFGIQPARGPPGLQGIC